MSDEAHDCDDAGAPPLTRAETLVLWAMRAWVAGHRHGIPVLANLRTAFRNEGAPAAAEAVDDLMGFIANGAGRTIQVNCPRCRQVTEDERPLWSTWRADHLRSGRTCETAAGQFDLLWTTKLGGRLTIAARCEPVVSPVRTATRMSGGSSPISRATSAISPRGRSRFSSTSTASALSGET